LDTGDQERALQRFERIKDHLPTLLEQLVAAKPRDIKKRADLKDVMGVYLLTEDEVPQYLGRTRNANQRLGQHYWKSSGHNSAPLAFNIARKRAATQNLPLMGSRAEIAAAPDFVPLFEEAKERVSQMEFRIVRTSDPVLSTIFEVYASVALETEGQFNLFETH
jgi:hypothetical protein